MLEICDGNLQKSGQTTPKAAQPIHAVTLVQDDENQILCSSFNYKNKPQRKKRKLSDLRTLLVNASTDMGITIVHQGCQTYLPLSLHSPQKFKSIPIATTPHAPMHDLHDTVMHGLHCYASNYLSAEPGPNVMQFPNAKRPFSHHMHCANCGCGIDSTTLKTNQLVTTNESCRCCNQPLWWQTQPFTSSVAAGNLLLSAGILFSSNNYGNTANLAEVTNMQFFSQRNFSSTRKNFLSFSSWQSYWDGFEKCAGWIWS